MPDTGRRGWCAEYLALRRRRLLFLRTLRENQVLFRKLRGIEGHGSTVGNVDMPNSSRVGSIVCVVARRRCRGEAGTRGGAKDLGKPVENLIFHFPQSSSA